ncbi:MAG: imidazole glycerol phosphate synthase subunit HisH [Candidatus Bathyarchaeia archaeon]
MDCGIGNLFSITCALRKIGLETNIVSSSNGLKESDAIVLPGVGNFKAGSESIQALRCDIYELINDGVPVFGICLGMQLLFESSEESQGKGLGLIKGKVIRFPSNMKTPHMGWNTLKFVKHIRLVDGIRENDYFYFVHSYYGKPVDREVVVANTRYGLDFASIVAYKNIWATQFHPEKSGKPGQVILRNFSKILKR